MSSLRLQITGNNLLTGVSSASGTCIEAATMFRLLGFIIGSLTSIGIILLVTGVPTFHVDDPEIDQKRFDEAVEKLMARKVEAERAVAEAAENIPASTQTAASGHSPEQGGPPASTEPMEAPVELPPSAGDAPLISEDVGLPEPDFAQPEMNTQWYAFWNPFRSQIAANGFVSQLEKVTGLDYRVVKTRTGVYEVAFAYADDAERRDKLAQISEATGLDLPDS
jgi:hypothetical protein